MLASRAEAAFFSFARNPSIERLIARRQRTDDAANLPVIGINTHLSRFGAGGGNTPNAVNIALMQECGASMARIDMVNWDQIERTLGSYDWTKSDAMISALRAANIKINILLAYANILYGSDGWSAGFTTQAQLDAYSNYCAIVASRYHGNDVQYELRNEPNLPIFWAPIPDPEMCAKMTTQAAAAIRAVRPAATILSPGISNTGALEGWGPYMKTWMSVVDLGNIDGFSFHPYNQGDLVGQSPESSLLHLHDFANVTKNSKPIYSTEWGYPHNWSSKSAKRQAILTTRAILTSIIAGVKCHLHYDLIDDGTDYSDDEQTYGLYDNSFAIKPAGIAFKAITAALAGCVTFRVGFDASRKIVSLFVQKANGQVIIVWTYDTGNSKTFTSAIGPGKTVSCVDLFGASKTCNYSGGSLSLRIIEAAGPLLVTVN